MIVNYNVAELACNIQLANNSRMSQIKVTNSKYNEKILMKLLQQGYISGFAADASGKQLIIFLKYYNGATVLKNMKIISKPGNVMTLKKKNLADRYRGALLLLSTKFGILTREEAVQRGVGGLALCCIY